MSRFAQVRAVLFDLDGTLVDSAPDLAHAADQMRLQRGLPSLPLAAYRCRVGSGARGMIEVAFGITPAQPEFEPLRQEFFGNYQACLTQRTQPFDGVESLLLTLGDRGRPWAVVTNKMERFALPLVASLGSLSGAAAVVGGDTTPHAKPHPAPLLEAARRIGLSPGLCLYVGDDERDIQAGRAAGMATVAARYGYLGVQTDVLAWGADAVIDQPTELLNFLDLA